MKGGEIAGILEKIDPVSYEDCNVLLTGGSGFLGSWLCETLIAQNSRVLCIDNLASGKKENVEHLIEYDNFNFIEHDISKPFYSDEKFDFIFHLASRASPLEFEKFPIEILKANSLGTLNALGIAKKNGARLLFTSTSEIYGNALVIPTPESYFGNVNPVGIRGCYDEAKRVGEAYCMAYFRQHNVDVRIARIFNTYGSRMRSDGHYGRVIPRFIDQALSHQPITIFGDGTQTRSFCYVTDQIEGLLKLAGIDGLAGEICNIGTEEEITINALAKVIIQETNSKSELKFQELPPDDPQRRCPVIEKAMDLLGWRPKVSLREGLRRMMERL